MKPYFDWAYDELTEQAAVQYVRAMLAAFASPIISHERVVFRLADGSVWTTTNYAAVRTLGLLGRPPYRGVIHNIGTAHD